MPIDASILRQVHQPKFLTGADLRKQAFDERAAETRQQANELSIEQMRMEIEKSKRDAEEYVVTQRINRGVAGRNLDLENAKFMEGSAAPEITAAAPQAEPMAYPGQIGQGPTMGGGTQQVSAPLPEMEVRGIPDLGVAPARKRPTSLQERSRQVNEQARAEQQFELEQIQAREKAQAAAKVNEPYTLNPGDKRLVGSAVIAEGAPKEDPKKSFEEETYQDYLKDHRLVLRYGPSRIGFESWQKDLQKSANKKDGLSEAMESNIVNRLTKQWDSATAPVRELERQINLMDTGLNAARNGNLAQGAQAVLVTFQKILDPTSVVRESEYMRSAAGLSLMQRMGGAMEQLMKGGAGVPLSELEKFSQLAKDAIKGMDSHSKTVRSRIEATTGRYGIPNDMVFGVEERPSTPPSRNGRPPLSSFER